MDVTPNAQTFRSGNFGLLRPVLALTLLLASMPAVVGVRVLDSGPALIPDICHPLQTLDRSSGPSLAPLLPAPPPAEALADSGKVAGAVVVSPTCLREAPDPPPPKLPA